MRDPALPGSAELLGDDPCAVLAPAIAAAGGELLSARPTQIRYDPGRKLAVRYAAQVAWADEPARTETLGALVTTAEVPDSLSVVIADDGARVGVWRYPHDPFLPGLPHVAYPAGARAVLARLGIDAPDPVVEPLVYRPGSRAVLRITGATGVVYAKVVRPRDLPAMRVRHESLAPHLPVPTPLGWSDPLGLLVLDALEGRPLTRALVDGGALPPPTALLDLLRRLGDIAVPVPGEPRDGAVAGAAALLHRAVPERSAEVDALVAAADDLGGGPRRTVHGDFYEAQVLTDGGAVTGLLDLDGVGEGGALDDVATFLGHLVALAHVRPRAADRIRTYAAEVGVSARAGLEADGLSEAALHRAVTGVLLGLATTSLRRQEHAWRVATGAWIDCCAAWARGEEALMPVPSSAHGVG